MNEDIPQKTMHVITYLCNRNQSQLTKRATDELLPYLSKARLNWRSIFNIRLTQNPWWSYSPSIWSYLRTYHIDPRALIKFVIQYSQKDMFIALFSIVCNGCFKTCPRNLWTHVTKFSALVHYPSRDCSSAYGLSLKHIHKLGRFLTLKTKRWYFAEFTGSAVSMRTHI